MKQQETIQHSRAEMFDKRPREWTVEDVRKVVIDQPPESDQLELKRTVPAKGNEPDRWVTHGDRIGDRGRNDLLAAMVGFANAHGGWLLVGINETRTKPPRAESIVPLPECADLAARLRDAARECIDPPLPVFEIEGIATEKDSSGVVVCHVPRSRAAPHRLSPDRHCYIRRGPTTEVMRSMRDIQDLTLNTARGLEEVQARLARRREAFRVLLDGGEMDEGKIGIRATLVPTTPLFIEKVHDNDAVMPPAIMTFGSYEGDSNKLEIDRPVAGESWEPILRGTRSEGQYGSAVGAIEVLCDGTIEYWAIRPFGDGPPSIHPSELIGPVANALCAIEKFRRVASAPGVEYALEVEVAVCGQMASIYDWRGAWLQSAAKPYPIGRWICPTFTVGSHDGFNEIIAWVDRDFWNAARIAEHAKLRLDFERAFRDAGIEK